MASTKTIELTRRSSRRTWPRIRSDVGPTIRDAGWAGGREPVHEKCTEPVTPPSGFPTDLRRSECRSESHQPRALRTRCNYDLMVSRNPRQASASGRVRKLRFFPFTTVELQAGPCALEALARKEGPGPRARPQNSPSRERFRPPSRRTFRFRVVLLGGLRPTGAPCSAQAGDYAIPASPGNPL